MSLVLLVACSSAFLITVVATPAVIWMSTSLGIVDRPDLHRKLHARVTPLSGGLAVFAGWLAGLAAAMLVDANLTVAFVTELRGMLGLLAATSIIVVVGLIDDASTLRGRQKLAGQFLACAFLVGSGLVIEDLQVLGQHIHLGPLAVPFTMVWLLGSINAVNLIDGVDGLASTVGIVLAAAVGVVAAWLTRSVDAAVAFALVGALAGFLLFNAPPARIFLGDTGSMLIGLLVGAIAIRASMKGPASVALAVPLTIWAIPIFDSLMAIVRRRLTGRSIYTTDRAHLHHVLQHRGYGAKRTVLTIGFLCVLTSLGALVSVYQQNDFIAVVTAIVVLALMVCSRLFGHAEMRLLISRAYSFAASLVPNGRQPTPESRQIRTRIQGNREWDALWEGLIGYCGRFNFTYVRLNVNVPSLHEEFHAEWRRPVRGDDSNSWSADFPIGHSGRVFGRLRVCGLNLPADACESLGELVAGLKPFEMQMLEILEDLSLAPGVADADELVPVGASDLIAALPAHQGS